MELRIKHLITFGLFNVLLLDAQRSPCPDVFQYENDGREVYGRIQFKPFGSYTRIVTKVNFTIAAALPSSYVGNLEYVGGDLLNAFKRDSPVSYKVHFPVTSPLPRITGLLVNDNVLCYGPPDVPGPGQYVTTVSLQHMLYLRGSGGGGSFNYGNSPPQTVRPVQLGPIYDNRYNDNTWDNGIGNNYWQYDNNYNSQNFGNAPFTSSYPEYTTERTTPPPRYQDPVTHRYTPPRHWWAYPTQPTGPPLPPRNPEPDLDRFNDNQPFEDTVVYPAPKPPKKSRPAPSNSIECGVIAGGNEKASLIYNGDYFDRGEWPWLVAVYKRKEGTQYNYVCAGTLVSDSHVITAAHCMHQRSSYTKTSNVVVRVGAFDLDDIDDDIAKMRSVVAAHEHESFDSTTLENDILILTLAKRVQFSDNIRPICLWHGDTDLDRIVQRYGVVAGWGKSEEGQSGRGVPKAVRIPVVSTKDCRASRPDFFRLTSYFTFCAGDRKGSGPCNGDSGGGLYILDDGRWRLRGIVSLSLRAENGDNTCNLNEYIVFTDTAQYLPWINTTINPT